MTGDEEEFAAVDAFTGGGRVDRSGIALVHEGEYIVPAAGSEALVSRGDGPGTVVHYHFPVEVEVVGALQDHHVRRVAEHVFAELDRELGSRG
ncbi:MULTISPECIES: hypothetical protein [unclassified Streptomyces]|uniref:hypothetical protein n=1 Tax=unclassified Streptomyces TaxID=2593676 RepID=UPI0016613680|nr:MULTISPECIES: hypothetical protein [unclassified Streptomyces]MBD0708192.1 hypothetical protein [Streptomyces sp. CBMA291]MBD0714498.1 hypothetical protein [Streptomyces sp. CBMA370]